MVDLVMSFAFKIDKPTRFFNLFAPSNSRFMPLRSQSYQMLRIQNFQSSIRSHEPTHCVLM